MAVLLLIAMLVLNFVISWSNATYVGYYWSESKEIGGSFRIYVVIGYIMAIAGFTMVYGYILLIISPVFLEIADIDQEIIVQIEQLSSDLIYLFTVVTIVPTGFYIWIRSLKTAWEERTVDSILTAGWNTNSQISNTINVARNAPSAISRVAGTLFGGSSRRKKKDNTIVILVAIFIVIVAILGGYFTASAIMKKADREYDMFADLQRRHPEIQ